jgi:hypothetical protein
MARRVGNVTWPVGRAPDRAYPALEGRAVGVGAPVPEGRGRWRFTLHARAFSASGRLDQTVLAEIAGARSRQLVQEYNKGATLTFTLDGHAAAARSILELQHDVIAWRWDEGRGADVAVFRGVVCQSQDTLSEQANTVTFTCHDYLAMLERRLLPVRVVYAAVDQDTLAADLVHRATVTSASGGQSLNPGAYLPLAVQLVDPSGASRSTPSGQPRDRTYEAQQKLDEALFNLAAVEGGFDYDVRPNPPEVVDALRVCYPYQGVLRLDLVLEYGSSVSSLSRSVNSANYGNYWRVVGKAPDGSPDGTPPLYAERWSTDANDVTTTPVGLWQSGDNASDVSVQGTLNDKAGADLALGGVLLPTYSLELRPGWYTWGAPAMGDVCTLRIRAGRLDVDSDVRVVGITYDALDDGGEDVKLTVGRPDVNFADLLTRADRDINALARR